MGFDQQQNHDMFNDLFNDQPVSMTTDRNMLLASLNHEAVEDAAESTLLDVLERRQVTWGANHDAVAPLPPTSARHRRNRSEYASVLPNIDLLNIGSSFTQRPSSAPSSSEAAQPLPRPSLPSRSISHGRSKRNLLHRRCPPSLSSSGRSATADWAFDSGELLQSFSELSDPQGFETSNNSPKEAVNQASSHDGEEKGSLPRPKLSKAPSYSMRGNTHHRYRGSTIPMMPLGFEGGASDSSQSSSVPPGLTTPGGRARFIALTMKAMASNKTDELAPSSGNADLADLMNIMEGQREQDDLSTGSRNKGGSGASRKSGGGASIRSRGSLSQMSGNRSSEHQWGSVSQMTGNRSSENQSRGGASGFSGGSRGRPFSGISSSPFSSHDGNASTVDQMFQVAELVHDLCQIPEEEEDDGSKGITQSDVLDEENANFLSQLVDSHPEVPTAFPEETEGIPQGEYGGVDEQTPMLQQNGQKVRRSTPPRSRFTNIFSSINSITQPTPDSRFYRFFMWWTELRKHMKMLAFAFDGAYVKERTVIFAHNEVSMFIVPALAISAFFYYRLGNPILSILPTDASISWWILFAIRNYLTFQLAYVIEYLFVDVSAMRSLLSIQVVGPLATLYIINAKGWPFILTSWGLLNLLLIQDGHQNNIFFSHWLYFTDIEMFTAENPSGGVVGSDTYKEILMSMIIAGVATALKRTVLAVYLGKRIYTHYKPKLEKVMEAMILLTEVADLGYAIDDFEFEKVDSALRDQTSTRKSMASINPTLQDKMRASTMIDVVKKHTAESSESDSDEEKIEEESKGTIGSTPWNRLRAGSSSSDEIEPMNKVPSQETLDNVYSLSSNENEPMDKLPSQDTLDNISAGDEPVPERTTTEEYINAAELPAVDNSEPPILSVHEPVRGLLHDVSTTTRIRSLLDEWEEPVNKADKMADPTIHEILQFRKALSFLDDTHPFGNSFGPAFSRDSCIKSAKRLYVRLLALSPGSPVLHFDVIGVLAYNIDGTFEDRKAKSLVRLFRPGKFDDVSLLHFVQSCDGVYKKLRYLRASVGNSTLIDSVLENIFDGVFSFFLALTIMSVLKLNPWTLLVSMSTVLVSFAFALGPSAAKLIEGMIMIAVRRPFDLGDRISIVDCTGAPDNSDDPGYHDTWIVEDCNLFTTTLRLSRTNELSTVNNGAIANTRIVNHGRSMNALVNISLPMRIEVNSEQVQIVQSALQQYIRDNPRVWASLVNFRITKVDPTNELIAYSARVQHVKSWQDLLPVMQAKGDLEKFCAEILFKLDIHYDGSPIQNEIFIKELPEQQEVAPDVAADMFHQHDD